MIKPDFVKRYDKIIAKWKKFKRLRGKPDQCVVGHPDFITLTNREKMFEDLLHIIEFSKDD